jgi:uncharacterized protein (AIM24 family)
MRRELTTLSRTQLDIHAGPSFAFGEVKLPPGGSARVEAGAMAMTRGDAQMAAAVEFWASWRGTACRLWRR